MYECLIDFLIQIRFFLLQNRQGKTRLSKWYQTPPDDAERVKMESDINRAVSIRTKGHTNFVEVSFQFSVFSQKFPFIILTWCIYLVPKY